MPSTAMSRPSLLPYCPVGCRQVSSEQYGAEIRDFDAIAAADDTDAVIICTPTDLHAQQIEELHAPAKLSSAKSRLSRTARVRACLEVVNKSSRSWLGLTGGSIRISWASR